MGHGNQSACANPQKIALPEIEIPLRTSPDRGGWGMVLSVGRVGNRRPGLEKVSGLLRIFRN